MADYSYYPRPPMFDKTGNSEDAINYNPSAANYYRNRCVALGLALEDALSRLPFAEVSAVLNAADFD